MLWLRRLLAAILDLAIVLPVAGVLILVWALLFDGAPRDTDLFLVIVGVTYWSLGGRLGQTPGKVLTGIVVQTTTGEPLTLYHSVKRVAVIACAIAAGECIADLCRTMGMPDPAGALNAFLTTSLAVAWPISVLFTGGRSGLHDYAARTCVRIAEGDTPGKDTTENLRPQLLSVAAAIVVGGIVGVSVVRVRAWTDRAHPRQDQMAEGVVALMKSLEELRGAKRRISGLRIHSRPWNNETAEDFTFRSNVEWQGDQLDLKNLPFKSVVDVEIDTTFWGLFSGEFQRGVAGRVGLATATPETIINVLFCASQRVGPLDFVIRNRVVGVVADIDSKGPPILFILEPDGAVGFAVGLVFDGWSNTRDDDYPANSRAAFEWSAH